MHDLKWIREHPEQFDLALKNRGIEPHSKQILEFDEEKRQIITLIQKLQKSKNDKAEQISKIKNKNSNDFIRLKKDSEDINEKLNELEVTLEKMNQLDQLLEALPNIPSADVPVGRNENANVEVKKSGEIRQFTFKPLDHIELGEKHHMIDLAQTAKISGSRFVSLLSDFAQLERALSNFMLDLHRTKFKFTEVSPPYLVKGEAMYGTGQLPKFGEDSFHTTNNMWLIPTAEVSLTNLVADKILSEDILPIRYTAYTPCFRSEAGAAGRDTRGMFRVHQFHKVELVSICTKEQAEAEHAVILEAAEEVLTQLKLPYRVMLLSTGDMGFAAQKTFDIEVWMPGQQKYREISSCSNCGEFQARRMKARYKSTEHKTNLFVNTLNGSGLAVGRCLIAIIENYQNSDGSITIPEVLIPYMHGKKQIG
jgi:seryl-tRNA synthetase